MTSRKIYKGVASTPAQAIAQLEAPTLTVLCEDGQTWPGLRRLLDAAAITGKRRGNR